MMAGRSSRVARRTTTPSRPALRMYWRAFLEWMPFMMSSSEGARSMTAVLASRTRLAGRHAEPKQASSAVSAGSIFTDTALTCSLHQAARASATSAASAGVFAMGPRGM